jgi:lysyl-tRNA synthetase class I
LTTQQKQELVLSILKEVNIPQFAIVVYIPDTKDRDKKIYKIIDGKQRLSSILGYCMGEFPIPCDDELFYFSELPKDIQNFLMRWEGNAQIAYSYEDEEISDEGLIKWFDLLNFAGTEPDKEHLELLKSKL